MIPHHTDMIPALRQSFNIEIPMDVSPDALKKILAEQINHLILSDFQKLVNILYRVDINEAALKQLLKENPETDAGDIIATLIIERQLQKLKSREQFRTNDTIPDDEKW
jgi:hypothetical protein